MSRVDDRPEAHGNVAAANDASDVGPSTLPDVTIITPAYNTKRYLREWLDSIKAQTVEAERIEIIAIDDCSTDGTYELLVELAAEWPPLRVLRTSTNTGSGECARNHAMSSAAGRYIVFLDSDDMLTPRAIELMLGMANENGTEIVLGKMKGINGRGVPRSMFKHDQPRTDIMNSRVVWTLMATKMFSRDLIDRTELRFPENLSYAADQPFSINAYLDADGISVVASEDIFIVRDRGDGTNRVVEATTSDRVKVLDAVFTLVTDRLPPDDERRELLLRRQFDFDVMYMLRDLPRTRERERDALLREAADILRPHFSEKIASALHPVQRVAIDLLLRDRLDEMYEVLDREQLDPAPEYIVRDGRGFEMCPYFRDESVGIPDSRYEITARVKPKRYLARAIWDGDVLEIAGHAYLHRVKNCDVSTELVVRLRDKEAQTPTEYVAPMRPNAALDPDAPLLESRRDTADHSGAGFVARIDVTSLAAGQPLGKGLWDIHVRLKSNGLIREARIGAHRDPDIDTSPTPRYVGKGDARDVATAYYTDPHGNLTIDIGEIKHSMTPTEPEMPAPSPPSSRVTPARVARSIKRRLGL